MPTGPTQFKELVTISFQRGEIIRGHITADMNPSWKWEFDGRYNGRFLQLMYRPASDAADADFIDYGCYFLQRQADGSFSGFSTGFGQYETEPAEGMSTDYHEMRRIASGA
jgi:hypothetical protein